MSYPAQRPTIDRRTREKLMLAVMLLRSHPRTRLVPRQPFAFILDRWKAGRLP